MRNRELDLEAALEWFLELAEENIDTLSEVSDDEGATLELKIGAAWALLRGDEE